MIVELMGSPARSAVNRCSGKTSNARDSPIFARESNVATRAMSKSEILTDHNFRRTQTVTEDAPSELLRRRETCSGVKGSTRTASIPSSAINSGAVPASLAELVGHLP